MQALSSAPLKSPGVATIKLDDPVDVMWGSHTRFEIELHFFLMDTIVQHPAECQRSSAGDERYTSSLLCPTSTGNGRPLDTDE